MNLDRLSFKQIARVLVASLVTAATLTIAMPSTAFADNGAQKKGRVTGLPVPRFVSFKAGAVNLRVGPGRKYAITWLYKKRGLPVEVIQEFDRWRRVRDSEGTTGWVLHSLLSSKRTALIAPWDREADKEGKVINAALHDGKYSASTDAATTAKMQAGLLVNIDSCQARWCEVEVYDTTAWLPQETLWGTYPGELIED